MNRERNITLTACERLHTLVLRGRDSILPYAPLLEAVAERFGQCGAMHWLPFFFSGQAARFKSPHLVLLLQAGTDPLNPPVESVFGCALFSEYVVFGLKTGAVTTEDTAAFRTVLGLPEDRAEIARLCAARLIDEGAQVVLATYGGEEGVNSPTPVKPALWTARERVVGSHLELASTYEETLAGFSKTMRFRLRHFRRVLQRAVPCVFVPDATAERSEQEFLALNRGCLNPVTDEEAALRWRASQSPGGYAMGLRTAEGEWLCLVGGWRQCGTTVLHWQLNMMGWQKHSLSTVMRSYFLEHEAERSTRRVVFFGGTPDNIRHYFPQTTVTDLVLRRPTLRARVLLALARMFASERGPMGRPNFLAEVLTDEHLQWRGTAKL